MTLPEINSILERIERIAKRHAKGAPSERVLAALDRETNLGRLNWREHIVGFGIGPKMRRGRQTHDYALRLYVPRKVASARLRPHERIPKRLHLRRLHRYLPVDVIEQSKSFRAQVAVQSSGIAAHFHGEPGVISLAALSTADNSQVLLSCAHVFAPRNRLLPQKSDNIIQSPPQIQRIGILRDFTVFGLANTVDAAVCTPDTGVTCPTATVAGHSIPSVFDASVVAPLGRQVWRIDSLGNRIEGTITAVDHVSVDFHDGFDSVPFQTILRYHALNRGGDSGGAVIDTLTDQLVGIHFAGDDGTESVMCLASLVFSALSLKLR